VTVSGVVVLVQFALFLFLGTLLYVYYQAAPEELQALTTNGRVATDRLFPAFIVGHLPSGLRGLVIAAVFAAAMSTLSSSLNSSAAATVNDFYVPATRQRRSREHYLSVARVTTAAWGAVQIAVAVAAISISTRVVDEVLGIAAFTNGVVLGVFLLGTLTAVGQRSALAGVAVGAAGMLAVKMYTAVSWQWYVLIGAALTCAVAVAADHARRRGRARS
jgi:Na+/proline symporter